MPKLTETFAKKLPFAESRGLRSELDEADFTTRAGNGINQQLISARLRWIARHEAEVFAPIATVLGSYDYIGWRLTGLYINHRERKLTRGG